MSSIDLTQQQLHYLYQPSSTEVEQVDVPALHVLALEGTGSPGSQQHVEACAVLLSLSYTIKVLLEQQQAGLEYTLMPLEGLWWTEDGSDWHQASDENRFWKLLMVQPERVSQAMLEQAKQAVQQQKSSPLLSDVRFELFHEGRSAQLLHIGPYADEDRTVTRIMTWIAEHGGTQIGTHHEIYLDDASRTPPERLRTILRYPFS
jgi:hypothetical protein